MSKLKIIKCPDAPAAIGPYSQAVSTGNLIFISGQIPIDPKTGALVSGDIKEQTERVIENIENILIFSGLGLCDIVKTTVYLTNLQNFEKFNAVYSNYFEIDPPARATVEVSSLPKGSLVEIDAVAFIK